MLQMREVVMRATPCVLVLAVLLLTGTVSFAQVEVAKIPQAEENTPFNLDAISFAIANSNLSRLDVYIQVPYENLSFVKRDEKYSASYEITINLFDSAGSLTNEKVWTEEIRASTFDESVSSQAYSLTQRVFELLPGRYNIVVTMRDIETKVTKRLLRQMLLSDYHNQPFSLSDIMLVSRLTISGDKKVIVPNISPNIGNLPGPLYVFFEAYGGHANDSLLFVGTVLNEKDEVQLEVDTLRVLESGRQQIFMRIPTNKLGLGDYKLVVRAFNLEGGSTRAEHPLSSTNRLIAVRWRGIPKGVKDLDTAIDQLQYLARDRELSYIKEGNTIEEKQKRFLEFWKRRDPNPNTARNEKMEEYYAKVEYANKHFKHYSEGWRTDMGMVYIIFGAPNNVDRHPFDIDSKPYEVWSYYELNHQFVFVDQTGFGDYRLATPIWEVWQRPKD